MSDWAAVAQVVNERKRILGISQRALAERSGVSLATLRKIEQGNSQRRSVTTLAAISRALGLADDHLRKVADGYAGAAAGEDAVRVPQRLEAVEAQLARLQDRVAALESKDQRPGRAG